MLTALTLFAGCREDVSLDSTVDGLFQGFAGDDVPGAAVLVIEDGRVAHRGAYGMANLDQGIPVTPATNFRLASLTKQFTAMAALLLVQDGKLALDAPVTSVLPELPAYANRITLRHLLTHTSGVPDYEAFVSDTQGYQVKDRDVLEFLSHTTEPYFAAGSAFRYSNSGYALLALCVERRSGERFADFLRHRIFSPLGMTGTVAFEDGISTVSHRAFGYTVTEGPIHPTDQSPTSAVLGDGGVYSSIDDLVRWDAALAAGGIVDDTLWREATTPFVLADGSATGYGFGWFIDRLHGHLRHWHHGETRGFTNAIMRFPEDHVTIVVLTNRSAGTPWAMAEQIADLVLR